MPGRPAAHSAKHAGYNWCSASGLPAFIAFSAPRDATARVRRGNGTGLYLFSRGPQESFGPRTLITRGLTASSCHSEAVYQKQDAPSTPLPLGRKQLEADRTLNGQPSGNRQIFWLILRAVHYSFQTLVLPERPVLSPPQHDSLLHALPKESAPFPKGVSCVFHLFPANTSSDGVFSCLNVWARKLVNKLGLPTH